MDAKTLAMQAASAQRAILGERPDIAHTYIRDIILKAAEIGTRGSMQRLYVQNPSIAAVLNYAHENKVLTGRMLEEYKKFKPVYENTHPFASTFGNTTNGFGQARARNMFWKQKYNVSGYNTGYTPPGMFFLRGEEADWADLFKPKGPSSPVSEI
jgi:hypothetical protein